MLGLGVLPFERVADMLVRMRTSTLFELTDVLVRGTPLFDDGGQQTVTEPVRGGHEAKSDTGVFVLVVPVPVAL